MADVGTSAARGQTLSPELIGRVQEIARKVPMAPEPFLIHGVLAQLDRQDSLAERLYLQARLRDPRSRAARFFLAERFLRTGRVPAALAEMAVLARLTNAAHVFAPALASYARTPGAIPQLRRFFRAAPDFEPVVLAHLATDVRNVGLILALWNGSPSASGVESSWQAGIVAKLVEAGDYQRAHALWRRFAGVETTAPSVFNSEFRESAASAPFNWTFGSTGGLAQPTNHGRLDVIYFGREDAVLAHQLLVLQPGQYVLGMQVNGEVGRDSGVAWTIECMGQKRVLLSINVERIGRLEGRFSVPHGCPAQQLRLSGAPGEFPKAVEFSVGRFSLARAPAI